MISTSQTMSVRWLSSGMIQVNCPSSVAIKSVPSSSIDGAAVFRYLASFPVRLSTAITLAGGGSANLIMLTLFWLLIGFISGLLFSWFFGIRKHRCQQVFIIGMNRLLIGFLNAISFSPFSLRQSCHRKLPML